MQIFRYIRGEKIFQRHLPPCTAHILPGLIWGRPDVLFTPAYWITQYWMHEENFQGRNHRLGKTFIEEVAACLLGGYGIPAEVGLAAFERLRDAGLINDPSPNVDTITNALRTPLTVRGRKVIYRFWSQKARYLVAVLQALQEKPIPMEPPRTLRDFMVQLPGIGPKTASWIVRNWLGSNEVAILDIHVVRAGRLMGLYSDSDRVDKHYLRMERRFLDLSSAMGLPTSNFDSLIWLKMRHSPRLIIRLLCATRIRVMTTIRLRTTNPSSACNNRLERNLGKQFVDESISGTAQDSEWQSYRRRDERGMGRG